MAVGLFRSESALEFFKEEVESAMARQHLRTSEWTSYYVVKLLAGYVAAGHDDQTFDGQPLGLRLAHALQSEGAAQREGLRSVGDASLFLAGFFSDSLNRRLVDWTTTLRWARTPTGGSRRRPRCLCRCLRGNG